MNAAIEALTTDGDALIANLRQIISITPYGSRNGATNGLSFTEAAVKDAEPTWNTLDYIVPADLYQRKYPIVSDAFLIGNAEWNMDSMRDTNKVFQDSLSGLSAASVKGRIARACAYSHTMYSSTQSAKYSVPLITTLASIIPISTMIKWHLNYPPDIAEIAYCNAISNKQGGMNPYVTYPYLLSRAYATGTGQAPPSSTQIVSQANALIASLQSFSTDLQKTI